MELNRRTHLQSNPTFNGWRPDFAQSETADDCVPDERKRARKKEKSKRQRKKREEPEKAKRKRAGKTNCTAKTAKRSKECQTGIIKTIIGPLIL